MSEFTNAARSSLLPGLLRVEGASRRSIYPHRIFEVGEVLVRAPEADYGTRTEIRLAAIDADAEANLSGLQSSLEALAYYLGIDYTLNPVDHPTFLSGRSGEIVAGDRAHGIIGEVHPEVLSAWGIGTPVSAFEVDISIAGGA